VNLRIILPDGKQLTASDVKANQLAIIDAKSGDATVEAPAAVPKHTAPAISPSRAAVAQQDTTTPHVVILFADDLGDADVGLQGGDVPTPAIDALAAESVRFTQGYVTASVCSPSRAGLMTGR
jgi:hypothetical protein